MEHIEIIIITLIFYNVMILLMYKNLKAKDDELENCNELRKIFINAEKQMIYLKDEKLKYIFANTAMEKFYNMSSAELIGKHDYELIDNEFATIQNKIDLEVLEDQNNIKYDIKWKERIYTINKLPIKLLSGKYGVGSTIKDITEEYTNKRKLEEMNESLNKSNILLSAILESSREIIVFALDINYCYISFNKRHKEVIKMIWGKDIEMGINMLEVIGRDDDRIKSKENFDKALTGESFMLVEEYGDERLSRLVWQNYYSPIYSSNGKVIGLTCFVLNITEQKKAEDEVMYLSYHDELTGLYNRRFFEEEINRLDIERNFPISIIVGDTNDLKLTNDIYGHTAGDELLIKIAKAFKKVCREDDIVARTGGDEFVILLPKTDAKAAERIMKRIKDEIYSKQIHAINVGISMGSSTKDDKNRNIVSVLEDAENKMYQYKSINRKNNNSNQMHKIIETLYVKYPREKQHAINVSKISQDIGRAMNLTNEEIKKIKDAGYLHDIGKIVLNDEIILNGASTKKDIKNYRQHSVVGYRILNSFDETLDIAETVLAHHEYWNGTGFPKGLKGSEIPLLARIIAVAESYDSMTNEYNNTIISKEEAIDEIKKQSGLKFDPNIVDKFIKMMM